MLMYTELFQSLGLSLNEARVYESLLPLGEAPVQRIALAAKVHRRNVYDSLAKLIEKGLVSELFVKGEKYFVATSPRRLFELLKEKEQHLNEAMPELMHKHGTTQQEDAAYFHRGIEGFKLYLQNILEEKQTVYFIGAKGFWLDPRLKHYVQRFERERKKLDIELRHLFDYEVKEKCPEILELVGGQYKFLPKEYSSSTAIDIFGDYVVTFVGVRPGQLEDEPLQFVMKSSTLAKGYRKFFDFMWDHCE